MYLFHRSARLSAGNVRDQLAWALAVTEKVNQISETPVNLWSTFLSPGVGTLAWTTTVDSLSTLEANNDKLLVDDSYIDLVDKGSKWDSGDPIVDGLLQYVVEAPPRDQPPAYSSVVRAVLSPGSFTRGIEVGVEIAKRAQKASGVPVAFAVSATGAYGEVSWLVGYDSIEQLETAQQKLNADAGFTAYLDKEAKDAYIAGATTQTVFRRIA